METSQEHGNDSGQGEATEKEPVSRKDFLSIMGVSACLGSVALSLAGSLRSARSSVLPDASQQFKIGKVVDYRPGNVRDFEEENVLVFSTPEGMHAISKICTHLGCIVNREGNSFQCPCHGSKYNADGEVTRGPAPRSLAWLRIARLPNEELIVDRADRVKTGTRFRFDDEKA